LTVYSPPCLINLRTTSDHAPDRELADTQTVVRRYAVSAHEHMCIYRPKRGQDKLFHMLQCFQMSMRRIFNVENFTVDRLNIAVFKYTSGVNSYVGCQYTASRPNSLATTDSMQPLRLNIIIVARAHNTRTHTHTHTHTHTYKSMCMQGYRQSSKSKNKNGQES
jgi:hypothetical protein